MGSSTHLDIHCALLVLDLCWYSARSPGARGQPRTGCCHLCTYVIGPLVGFGSHDCHMTGHFQACMHASSLVVCFGSILILYLVVTHVVVELAALRVLSFTFLCAANHSEPHAAVIRLSYKDRVVSDLNVLVSFRCILSLLRRNPCFTIPFWGEVSLMSRTRH